MGPPPFEQVVAEHHAEIYRYLRRTVARTPEAEDLAQETFLRAYRAYRRLPADARVRPWLFTIATNVARNHFRSESRRRRAHTEMERAEPSNADGGADGDAMLGEIRVQLDAAVLALPPKQRLAFTLRKVHDLDYDAMSLRVEDGKGGHQRVVPIAELWPKIAAPCAPLLRAYRLSEQRWDGPIPRMLARLSVSDWLDAIRADRETRALVRGLRGFFLADPEELSLLALVDQLASDPPGPGPFFRIRGGNDRLATTLEQMRAHMMAWRGDGSPQSCAPKLCDLRH